MGLDIAVDQFPCFGIHRDRPRAIDHSIGNDGLRVDAWERLGGFFGEDGGFGCHVDADCPFLSKKMETLSCGVLSLIYIYIYIMYTTVSFSTKSGIHAHLQCLDAGITNTSYLSSICFPHARKQGHVPIAGQKVALNPSRTRQPIVT